MAANTIPASVSIARLATSSTIFEGMLTTIGQTTVSKTVNIPAGDHVAYTARAGSVSFSDGQTFSLTADTPKVVTLPDGATSVTFTLGTGLGSFAATAQTNITAPALAGTSWLQTVATNVAYTSGIWVAMGGSTTYYTSTNGVNWTARTASFSGTYNLQGVNNLFFAFQSSASTPTTTFYTSPDGITWTSRTLPAAYGMQNVVYASTIGRYACIGSNSNTSYSTNNVLSSTDGFTWTSYTLPNQGTWSNIAASPTRFVACSGAASPSGTVSTNVVYSTNGTTWTTGNRVNSSNNAWTFYNPGDTYFYATNAFTGGPERSTDGITWANYSTGIMSYVGNATQYSLFIKGTPTTGTINGTNYYAFSGNNSVIAISTDGINWTSGTMLGLYSSPLVIYNNRIIVTGSNANSAQYTLFTPAAFGLYAGPGTII